jgi:hypothetical protein
MPDIYPFSHPGESASRQSHTIAINRAFSRPWDNRPIAESRAIFAPALPAQLLFQPPLFTKRI